MSQKKLKRRDFLKLLGFGAGSAFVLELASKVKIGRARSSAENPDGSGRSWAMVMDQEKCIGCGYCIEACRAHNDIPPQSHGQSSTKPKRLEAKPSTFQCLVCIVNMHLVYPSALSAQAITAMMVL